MELTLSHQEAQILATLISLTVAGGEVGKILDAMSSEFESVGVPFKGVDWTDDKFDALADAVRPFSNLTLIEFNALEDAS